jgi:hypothetical protein
MSHTNESRRERLPLFWGEKLHASPINGNDLVDFTNKLSLPAMMTRREKSSRKWLFHDRNQIKAEGGLAIRRQ